jgi:hypothetical protein
MIHDHALTIHYERYDQQVRVQTSKFTCLQMHLLVVFPTVHSFSVQNNKWNEQSILKNCFEEATMDPYELWQNMLQRQDGQSRTTFHFKKPWRTSFMSKCFCHPTNHQMMMTGCSVQNRNSVTNALRVLEVGLPNNVDISDIHRSVHHNIFL